MSAVCLLCVKLNWTCCSFGQVFHVFVLKKKKKGIVKSLVIDPTLISCVKFSLPVIINLQYIKSSTYQYCFPLKVLHQLFLFPNIYKDGKVTSLFNPLTPLSDEDRISPYNIITISSRPVMRIKRRLLVNLVPSSLN